MPQVHLIGNSHIDPVWLWRWQDGFAETLATFRSAIDRLREFPDTFFTSACAVYYQWIEETDPSMFEEIKALVKAEGVNTTAHFTVFDKEITAPVTAYALKTVTDDGKELNVMEWEAKT